MEKHFSKALQKAQKKAQTEEDQIASLTEAVFARPVQSPQSPHPVEAEQQC